MVPEAFILLDELPLTPNGKLDRRALPTLDRVQPRAEAAFVAPRSPLEKLLAQTWREVLKTERVGIGDNFFALGGNSLLAVRLVSRLSRATGVALPLQLVFNAPTIAEL